MEGLIALGLLALVAGGTFGVLLSSTNRSRATDIREEMLLAVENANDLLQMYTGQMSHATDAIPLTWRQGLCGNDSTPLSNGQHNIDCLLPGSCDPSKTPTFFYEVHDSNQTVSFDGKDKFAYGNFDGSTATQREIYFVITCNGYTL